MSCITLVGGIILWYQSIIPSTDVRQLTLTLNNNSPMQDYVHPEDQTQPTFEMTPGFKPFTGLRFYKIREFRLPVQRAKIVVSDSPGLVDFAIGLVNSVLSLPDGRVKIFQRIKITEVPYDKML